MITLQSENVAPSDINEGCRQKITRPKDAYLVRCLGTDSEVQARSTPMTVLVHLPSNRTVPIRLQSHKGVTIADLRKLVAQTVALPAQWLTLVYKGVSMSEEDEAFLSTYNV